MENPQLTERTMTDHARPNWAPGMIEDGIQSRNLRDGEFEKFPSKNPHQAFLIAGQSRPGFIPFMQELEYFHYTPDTPRNSLFELIFSKWQEMVWVTVAIPLIDMPAVEELGKKYGFEFVKNSLPMAITEKGNEWFPMEPLDNVFSVQGFIRDEAKVAELTKTMEDVIEAHTNKVMNDVGA
jgi:hypothetical protein